MKHAYELFIGRRYLRSARGKSFASFISVISMAEWNAFITTVTQWDYDRYLKIV